MNETLFLYVNGEPVTISGATVFSTLANYLRNERRATGTKIVCEEGDCGACTVLIGRIEGGKLRYRPINSCIQFLYQLNATHIITVEGLRDPEGLNPVQAAMVACHGAQCGFCTPGFIVSMCALLDGNRKPARADVRDAVTGNLCRCTGYDPIIEAGVAAGEANWVSLPERYPDGPILSALQQVAPGAILIETPGQTFYSPSTIEEAVRFKSEHPNLVIVQGATDIGVQCNKRGIAPEIVMTLSAIEQLYELHLEDGELRAGAAVTLTRLEEKLREVVPELYGMLRLFGAPQIRHAGTLAGNIANASPIADTLPFLYVMNARVEVTGVSGSRTIPIGSFYKGYKQLDLGPDELITRIFIPVPSRAGEGDPATREVLRLFKVSRRRNLDISTFTAAVRLSLRGSEITAASVAYGGVGPVVLRLPKTEAALQGSQVSLELFEQAGELAASEISPISDVRGSKELRSRLASTILLKFYHETFQATPGGSA